MLGSGLNNSPASSHGPFEFGMEFWIFRDEETDV